MKHTPEIRLYDRQTPLWGWLDRRGESRRKARGGNGNNQWRMQRPERSLRTSQDPLWRDLSLNNRRIKTPLNGLDVCCSQTSSPSFRPSFHSGFFGSISARPARLEKTDAVSAQKQACPGQRAAEPSSSSIRSRRLYFATRSLRLGAPVLICPAPIATARSAMVVSSVSPERWETTAV